MLRLRTSLVLVLGLVALAGCRHRIPAPYARGQGPAADQLLLRTEAQLPALQVSKAKIVANRYQRANLAMLAEAPARFRGTVEVAGNELVTLAFHEQGYALRYKMDAFAPGFYEGPPSPCAVEALLGVSFDSKALVDLVLGGAPVIAAPFEVLEQKWERRGGYERLTIANDALVQELRFGWVAGQWRVVGGQLWERTAGKPGRRLWTMEHIELVPAGAAYLPTKTKLSTPGKRRDQTVVINYKERDPDPAFAKRRTTDDGGDDGGDDGDPWEDDGGWEDGADDDGGWEDGADDDGGWENGGAPADGEAADGGGETGEPSEPEPEPEPKKKTPPPKPHAKPAEPAIPPEFRLEPTGLTKRGDLCR
ncbi:MAG: hypothetical protein AB1Z98_38465 [Nannocystaceae bacterium]